MSEKGISMGTLPSIGNVVVVSSTPPTSLSYPEINYQLGVNVPLTAQVPTISNQQVSYFITPTLPLGLNLDATSGALSGTPLAASPATQYTVTAINSSGSTSASLSIMVDGTPPSPIDITDDGLKTSNGTVLNFSWTPSTDPESGIVKYEYSIGSEAGLQDLVAWSNLSLTSPASFTSLSLVAGSTYFMNISVTNGAGLTTTSSSNGITFSYSPGVWALSRVMTGSDDYYNYYENNLYWCSSTACQTVLSNPNDNVGGTINRFPHSVGAYVQTNDSYPTETKYCLPSGCTVLTNDFAYTTVNFDLSGRSLWYYFGQTLLNCTASGCTTVLDSSVNMNIGFQKISYPVYGYNIYVSKSGQKEAATIDGTPIVFGDAPYLNGIEKIWRVVSRGSTLYLVTCSPSACTNVSALSGAVIYGARISPSPTENAAWLTTNTDVYYCTESACTSLLTSTGLQYTTGIVQTNGNSFWFIDGTNKTRYCTKTSCGTALTRNYNSYGKADEGGGGLWSIASSALYYCNLGTCNSVLSSVSGNPPLITNSQATGAWAVKTDGIYYCSSTTCSKIQSIVSPTIPSTALAQDKTAAGAWFHNTTSGKIYYCTTTACTDLPKPASMTLVDLF